MAVGMSLGSVSAMAAAEAAENVKVKKFTWAGCGISKNAFMPEMATSYQQKTGVVIDFKGGGATKGIRQVSSREVDIGATCRQIIDGYSLELLAAANTPRVAR